MYETQYLDVTLIYISNLMSPFEWLLMTFQFFPPVATMCAGYAAIFEFSVSIHRVTLG